MKILTLDVETSPHEAYAFQVWNTNILSHQIKTPTKVLCWAAKFLGSKRVYYRKHDEAAFLKELHRLHNEADIIVHYNGDKFDLPHIRREFIEAGLPPTRPCPTIDTELKAKWQTWARTCGVQPWPIRTK